MKTSHTEFKKLEGDNDFEKWCEWVEKWNERNQIIQAKRNGKPIITYTREPLVKEEE